MSTPDEIQNVPEAPLFDPFPEPRTMPSGWDMSGLVPDSGPTPAPADQTTDEDEA